MVSKTKLEFTWIGKENRPKLEPRILLGDSEKSYHAPHRLTDHDLFDNQLIFGDNLLPNHPHPKTGIEKRSIAEDFRRLLPCSDACRLAQGEGRSHLLAGLV